MFTNTFNKLLTEEMGIIRNVQTDTRVIVDKIKLGNYIEFDPEYLKMQTEIPIQ